MIRIGIDVGGTNTDAVLIDGTTVRHAVKTVTTPDVGTGIVTALRQLLAESKIDTALINAVMIGTTHFTNAVVQRRHLAKIAAVRIGLPAGATLEPFVDWPADLRELVQGPTYMLRGGHEVDGQPIVPFDTRGHARRGQIHSRFRCACGRRERGVLAPQCRSRTGGGSNPGGVRSWRIGNNVA